MKKIGLIGGMSYESTMSYYEQINRKVNERLGALNSAEILLSSLNFEEIEACQCENRWDAAGEILARHARILQGGGCDFIFICTNTMHKCFDAVQSAVSVPVVHIAQATLKRLLASGVQRVGLLGTIYTMKESFYKETLQKGGMNVLIPSAEDMRMINDVIFKELCLGKISPDSKRDFLRVIDKMADAGAQGAILGCTEIGMLVSQADTDVRLFDTTQIHIDEAVGLALS